MSGLARKARRQRGRTPIMRPERRWELAVHEAGHVVAFEYFGLPYNRAEVGYSGRGAGRVWLQSQEVEEPDAVSMATTFMAGVVAQAILLDIDPGDCVADGRYDAEAARQLFRAVGASRGEIERLQWRLHDMLQANRGALEAIAHALDARGRLSPAEVGEILAGTPLRRRP